MLQLKCYKGHSAEVTDCQANQDSSQLISCSNDKSVILWDVETGKILRRFRNMAPFNTIAYGHGATTALAGSADGTVRIYDLRTLNAWEPIQTLTEANDSITCCRVSNQMIFTTSLDKGLRTYDLRKGNLSIDSLHMALNCVSVSQDAQTLLVGCLRGPILLLDRLEGKILNEFSGHDNKLFKIESSFAMRDSHIVAGSEDGQVYLWNCLNSEPHMSLKHDNVSPAIIQSVSSDSLDYLLTTCANYLFMWCLS